MKKLRKATGTKLLSPDVVDQFGRHSDKAHPTDAMKRPRNSISLSDEGPGKNDSNAHIDCAKSDSIEITNKIDQERTE